METPLPFDPLAVPAQSALAPGPAGPAPAAGDKPKPKNKGGRRSTAEEVDRYLASAGLVTTPVKSAADLAIPANGNPVPLVVVEPFDEVGTRAGIAGLLGGADLVAQWQFERAALAVTEDAKAAKKFGEGAAMPPPTKDVILNSAVETCRKHNMNIGPEAGLIGGIGQWLLQLRGLYSDLKKLADLKAKQPGQTGKTGSGA